MKKRHIKLDPYEQEIEDHIEKSHRLPPSEQIKEKTIAKQAAQNYFRKKKEKRISIRVFAQDLEKIKIIAEEEGLPYQTLITSILHKFSLGHLKHARL